MREPPAVAKWMLDHFVVQDALTGDLNEEFSSGRSPAWYWKQAVLAILVHAFWDVREHKLLTLRAVAVGWSFLLFWAVVFFDLLSYGQWSENGYVVAAVSIPWIGFFAVGVLVSRYHRTPSVFVFLGSILVMSAMRQVGLTPEWLPGTVQPSGWYAAVAAVAISVGVLVKTLWMSRQKPDRTGHRGQRVRHVH